MKKVIAIALAILLPLPAYAAVKAGGSCPKLGQISISKIIKFTCVKSGKKLVWDKGKKITVATPSPTVSPKETPSATSTPTSSSSPSSNSLTKSLIATHNKQNDCWTYMGEKVYNLTPWMSEHPGGAEIMLEMCGKDGSAAFGSHHTNEVDAYLAQYLIGNLSKA